MKNRILLISITFFISSCSTKINPDDVIGIYRSAGMNTSDRIYYGLTEGTKRWIIKSELELLDDQTFKYNMCGTYSEGKWELTNNKLNLIVEHSEYKNDSLATLKTPNFKERPGLLRFKIKTDELVGIVENPNKRRTLNKMVKTNSTE